MRVYYKSDDCTLYQGKMQDVLDTLPENSIDSIVCDPPYELNFMNKGWDNSGIAFQKETWQKCFSVLKRGGVSTSIWWNTNISSYSVCN